MRDSAWVAFDVKISSFQHSKEYEDEGSVEISHLLMAAISSEYPSIGAEILLCVTSAGSSYDPLASELV